ncbi:MAG: hypothetical protein JWN22_1229 [Nocardioides sp.]|nr:hypothetical protein [Nocardioides sp.]
MLPVEATLGSTGHTGHAVLPQGGLPTARLTLEGRLLGANGALLRLLGRRLEQVEDRDLWGLVACSIDIDAGRQAMAEARAGTPSGDFSQFWHVATGSPVPVRVAWARTPGEDDTAPATVTVFCLDRSREAAAEGRWRAVLQHASDLTWVADSDGVILDATPGAVHQLGRSLDELVGGSVHDLPHPDDAPKVRATWDVVASGEARQQTLECRLLHSDGRWVWVRQTLTDYRDDPHVRAIVGNATDISDQVEADRMRSSYAVRFRTRFEQSPVPQAFCDLAGRLTDVNAAFCRLLERQHDDLVGLGLPALDHPSDDGEADRALRRLLEGGAESTQHERTLATPDGRPLSALIDLAIVRDEAGGAMGATIFVQDLTTLRTVERRWRRQEDLFLALAQRASDLAIVLDSSGVVLYASPALTSMLGYSTADVVQVPGPEFIHPEDVEAVTTVFERVVAEGGTETVTMRLRDSSGNWRVMELTASNLLDTAVSGIVCNLRDITDRIEAERALRASESRYRAIADNADDGLWVTAPDGRTAYVNNRMLEILGLDAEEIQGRPLWSVLDLRQRQIVQHRLAIRGAERYQLTYQHPDGGERVLSISACPLDDVGGATEGSLAMVADITEARALEDQLRQAALHDTLTRLPNRALLLDRLQQALARQTRSTAVLFVDLDQFKIVNDARGHAAGDELLVGVAARLRASARLSDTVARFGGDEFLVVCEDVDESEARTLAEGLLAALDPPFRISGGEVHLTASIGVALSPVSSSGALLSHADAAMYAAKLAGRHRVRIFDAALAASAEERYELGSDLRRALTSDEMSLHHQPIIDLRTGLVVGTEALARWNHPTHGQVPPERFVAVAEDVGLAPELDRWALTVALADARALREAGAMPPDGYVAVNFSARTLSDPGLEAWIHETVSASGIPPHQVLIEVTESAIMIDAASAVALLGRLRRRGFLIAVDDFGTGHSSLAYLRNLPLSMLKIDRSFIAEITTDSSARAIAASIIELARAVGLTVVAEGVETPEHARLLLELGCDAAQGWLWSPAVSPEAAQLSGALRRDYEIPGLGESTAPRA